jgi:dipeptidyl-peptidase-3
MSVDEVQVFKLGIEAQFRRLTDREKRYAHHMARLALSQHTTQVILLNSSSSSAWYGSRIILQQVSPESQAIFDFIIELHRICDGVWRSFIGPEISSESLERFLTYAATFLSNIGNYYVSANQCLIV